MKHLIYSALAVAALGFGISSCDTEVETIDIQDLYTYDAQYYQNLREWKATPHEISYAYYASWSNTQAPTSWGERLLGLPDSMDIVNLWTDIPTPEKYPVAYEDMVYCQQMKGTRFVMHGDASHFHHTFWYRDEDFNIDKTRVIDLYSDRSKEALQAYARWAVDTVVRCGLDGVDFDYEGWDNNSMTIVAKECDKYFGPEGRWPEKLFIIDWFGGAPSGCDDYCDYFIRQAYTWQIGFQTSSGGRPMEKTVLCESTGAESADGGVNGARVRDYAAWEPESGHKGGFGAYYMDYNYKSKSGIPYKEFREAIQIQNPAINR